MRARRPRPTAARGALPVLLLLGLVALGSAASRAVAPSFRGSVAGAVEAARRIAPAIGVDVVDLTTGESVYSFHPDTLRIAASNTKLFTSAAALDRLGPGFFFETPVLVRGKLRAGVLEGDLAIVGGGDPNISGRHYNGRSYGAFAEWAVALSRLGIREIAGDLLLVEGLFEDEWVHPDWPKDQLTRWYEAPVAALSFNDNCVLVKVQPTAPPGSEARVEVVPPLPLFRVDNRALVTGDPRRQQVRIDRRGRAELAVSGRLHRRTESWDRWVAVEDPVEYFGVALWQALRQEGLAISGKVLRTPNLTGRDWRVAHTHRTDLLTTLEVVNKRSQNFYAESVLKVMGARLCDSGSWPGGLRAVTEYLEEVGLVAGSYEMSDGSGMSRGNRFSPRQVTRLLVYMSQHRHRDLFMQTLPYSGELGLSWEERLAEPPYRGNVMAKTGSLNGVSTLSGYAKARSGRLYAFSILMNRSSANWRARKAQDAVVRAIIDHG